jgi:CRP-like cAMP-binding protein
VAHLLLELFFRLQHRLPAQKGETVSLPLTLANIGDAVGLTNVHVSRVLRALREDGVLHLRRSQLIVLDPGAFIAAADIERGFPVYPSIEEAEHNGHQAKA